MTENGCRRAATLSARSCSACSRSGSGIYLPYPSTPWVDLTIPLTRDAVLLRIFIGEDDKADHQPLYEAIVLKAREMHLAGATVLRGPLGFGHSRRLHTTKVLRLSQDLPLVIEIVDSEDKIHQFVVAIEPIMGSALVTTEKVKVIRYGESGPSDTT